MNVSNFKPFVLCRPQGGINDILCQIEKCCKYAEIFDRRVVVDTNYSNAINFRDNFSNYFISMQERLELEPSEFDIEVANLSIYPTQVKGVIRDNRFEFSPEHVCFVDAISKVPLTFDFSIAYNESALLHQTGGGGNHGISALRRLRMHDSLVDLIIERLKFINSPYFSIHVRNTDYETDYIETFMQLSMSQIDVPLLICTDDENVLLAANNIIKNTRIINFSDLKSGSDKRLHFINDKTSAKRRNNDALVDLMLLSISSHFMMMPLKPNAEAPNGGYSGFSMLANALHNDRNTLHKLLGRNSKIINLFSPTL